MLQNKNNELMKYAYLLDQDNYCIENKIFIDMMWSIAKDKMISKDKNGKKVLKAKSYVIRNAGIMFQQVFYWHFNAIKSAKGTKYKYKEQNVVKMDFEDWWNSIRLTDTEVTTANKFLLETGLIKIVKMRIKQRDKEVYKPSNCYIINIDLLENYLSNIIEISKSIYESKVENVRKQNVKTSLKSKQYTELSTENAVTPETSETLKTKGLDDSINKLSTLSTSTPTEEHPDTNSVTLETGVTKDTLETGVTKDTLETGVTYISNTSFTDTSFTDTSETLILTWDNIKEELKKDLTPISFVTWIDQGIIDVVIKEELKIININTISSFNAEILVDKYLDKIDSVINSLINEKYEINIKYLS